MAQSKELELGFPSDPTEQRKAVIVASVVIVVAVTPTLFDGYDAWVKHPNVRALLVLWYAFVLVVAFTAWRVFLNE